MENMGISDDPNNAAEAKTKEKTIIKKDGAALTEDMLELDRDTGGPQSADILDQGLLSTMEQLDIAEPGEPFIASNSRVGTFCANNNSNSITYVVLQCAPPNRRSVL